MNKGWISIHRKMQDHWLWKEKRKFSKLEAWLDILFMANHNDNKLLFGNELINVERGSFITSELKLMDRWKWSKSKVRNFLFLLQKDKMIIKKSDNKKTTLRVLNYSDYQNLKTSKEHQKDFKKTSKEHQKDTNNNDNKYNNYNNENNNDEVKENILYDIDDNFKFYINNQKIVNAVISNQKNKIKDKDHLEKRLKEFNISLTETGQDKKLFTDYCSHFRSWHIKTLPKVNGYNHQKIIL